MVIPPRAYRAARVQLNWIACTHSDTPASQMVFSCKPMCKPNRIKQLNKHLGQSECPSEPRTKRSGVSGAHRGAEGISPPVTSPRVAYSTLLHWYPVHFLAARQDFSPLSVSERGAGGERSSGGAARPGPLPLAPSPKRRGGTGHGLRAKPALRARL